MSFTIEKNRHIFACWAASRAAGVSPLCKFKVENGKGVLDRIFGQDGQKALDDALQKNQKDFDDYHHNIIKLVMKESKKKEHSIKSKKNSKDKNFTYGMTYGVAAKLINIYFKVMFICGNYKNKKGINYIHPPIDSLLLDSLYKQKIGKDISLWRESKWSKMNSEDYQNVINGIKDLNLSKGLWSVEEYWIGHQ